MSGAREGSDSPLSSPSVQMRERAFHISFRCFTLRGVDAHRVVHLCDSHCSAADLTYFASILSECISRVGGVRKIPHFVGWLMHDSSIHNTVQTV